MAPSHVPFLFAAWPRFMRIPLSCSKNQLIIVTVLNEIDENHLCMLVFVFLLILLLLFYTSTLVWLCVGLGRLRRQPLLPDANAFLPTVSVIVAARNEAHQLPNLIKCLAQLDYPPDRIEFCLVDDRSEDDTGEVMRRAAANDSRIKVLHLKGLRPNFAPKKRALDAGINATRGEILLFTDADCMPQPGWARAMVRYFQHPVVIVPGYSFYRFDRPCPAWLRSLLNLEYFTHAAIAAAGIGCGLPLTACGCNLAYRREIYVAADGFRPYRHVLSGDDDLFLHQVHNQKLGRPAYAILPQSFVSCAAPSSWKQFWHQRIRYASKGRFYGKRILAGLLAVYTVNFLIVAELLFSIFISPATGKWLAMGWALKAGFEFWFLLRATGLFKARGLLWAFPVAAVLHPFYVVAFGALGTLGKYEWKKKTV